MKSYIYSRWDGAQKPFSLERREMAQAFLNNLMKGLSPELALAQMLWDGFPLAGKDFRVMGLQELLNELQQAKKDLFAKYNLDRVFDLPRQELEFLLADENMTRRARGLPPAPAPQDLPPGLVEKLKSLADFSFANPDSRKAADEWLNREQDILELYEFYDRYHERFTGEESLDYFQALELMRRLQSIEKTQQQILTGRFQSIDPEALRDLLNDDAAQSLAFLIDLPSDLNQDGLARFTRSGIEMTPRGLRALGELAFDRTFYQPRRDRAGGQRGNAPASGDLEPDSSRPYLYGDRFDLDINRTLFSALLRQGPADGFPEISPEDFHVREREPLVTSTTVLLLDLSWSMSWEDRFYAAKKVALALDHYIRTRFPKDRFHIVGFSTEARELKGRELALAVWDTGRPYTNLQAGLRLAMKLVDRSGNRNNRVIVITDGQPTAYYRGEHLHVELPADMFGLSPNASRATLDEVRRVTARGMKIETFMLDDHPVLVEFTREVSRINGGRAVVCRPDELGRLVVIEEINRRRPPR